VGLHYSNTCLPNKVLVASSEKLLFKKKNRRNLLILLEVLELTHNVFGEVTKISKCYYQFHVLQKISSPGKEFPLKRQSPTIAESYN
jgi:hypothetical protein